ncbi:MAG: bifunctional nuclease family protein [Candidatus Bathyarchaeia archaeon]|nr:bifunctional nuclease family protein [Candidatus Bathyarchaeota archaeon]
MEEFVKVQISGFAQVNTPYGPTPVLLLEDDVERILVIVIGEAEASSIAAAVRGFQSPVPNTHDFMMRVLDGVNVRVKKGEIYNIQSNRFLARITVESSVGDVKVDGRPSDIIALTVRAGADMYVTEDIMKKASIEKSVLLKEPEESAHKDTKDEDEEEKH